MSLERIIEQCLPALMALPLLPIAYFSASGTADLVAHSALALGADVVVASLPPATIAVPPRRPPPSAAALIAHNIFDHTTSLAPKPPAPAAPSAALPQEPPRPDLSDPLHADPCEDLDVSIVSERRNPLLSVAVLKNGDKDDPEARHVGDSVGGYKVQYIGFNYLESSPAVWLTKEASLCQALLFSEPQVEEKAKPKKSKKARRRAKRRKRSAKLPKAIAKRIDKVGDQEFDIDRSVVDDVLEKKAQLMRGVRMIPQKGKDGKPGGVRLLGVTPSSLLGTLGIKSGDSIKTINGFTLTDPEKALQAYAGLRTADSLRIELNRRGKSETIELNLK